MITTLRPLVPAELPAQQFAPGRALRASGDRDDAVRVQCTVADLAALTDAANGVRIFVELDVAGLATGTIVDVAALTESGVVELALTGHASVGVTSPVTSLVALLRDAIEYGLTVRWHSSLVSADFPDEAELMHLAPPIDARAEWARAHRYAQLYWRKGPNFVSVVDKRGETQTRYVLDEPELLAVFDALAVPVPLDAMPGAWQEPLRDLLDARLLVQGDGWVTRLPYRLRRWPMPSEGV